MSVAYHSTVLAMEDRPAQNSLQRFVQSLRFAHVGHVPYERHVLACLHAQSKGLTEGGLLHKVRESLSWDINPLVQTASQCTNARGFVEAFNLYNLQSNLGWKTKLGFMNDQDLEIQRERVVERSASTIERVELTIAKDCTAACAEVLLSDVRKRAEGVETDLIASSVSALINRFGLSDTPFGEATLFFEAEPDGKVTDLAKKLGCSDRTLNRFFESHGVRPTELKQVIMLNTATRLLSLPMTLTEIAVLSGYFDLAHFTRSFTRSVGVTPSALRRAAFKI